MKERKRFDKVWQVGRLVWLDDDDDDDDGDDDDDDDDDDDNDDDDDYCDVSSHGCIIFV